MNLGKHTCFLKRRRNFELHYTWNWCDFKYCGSRHFDCFCLPLWKCMACCKFYIIWSYDASFIYVINPITCTKTRTEQKTFLRLWIIHPFISLLQVRTLPFYLVAVQNSTGWTLFAIVWGLAIGGTIFKSFFVKKFLFTSTFLYVVMGWLIVFVWNDLVANIHPTSLILLIIGGLLYTVGAVFYIWKLFKHHHAVWHVFVLSATVCHFFAVLYLLP